MPRPSLPKILYTDERCSILGACQPDIPLVRDGHLHVIRPISDYLRHLVVKRNLQGNTTVKQYAYVLREFWTELCAQKRDWRDIDDDLLVVWRNKQHRRGVDKRTINSRLGTVLEFYWWAQEKGHVAPILGEAGWTRDKIEVTPVPATVTFRKDPKAGRVPLSIDTDIKYQTYKRPKTHNPSDDEVARLHTGFLRSSTEGLAVRNSLIAELAEKVGMRRDEIVNLKVEQVPSRREIATALAEQVACSMHLSHTKGGKAREVLIHPLLAERLQDFIEIQRGEMANRFIAGHRQRRRYPDPAWVFLSTKTGERLNPKSISNLFRETASRVGVAVRPHLLRGKFATDKAEEIVSTETGKHGAKFDIATAVLKLMELLGHADKETSERYIKLELRKRLETGGFEQRSYLEEQVEHLAKQATAEQRKLLALRDVRALAAAIENQSRDDMRKALEELIKKLAALN